MSDDQNRELTKPTPGAPGEAAEAHRTRQLQELVEVAAQLLDAPMAGLLLLEGGQMVPGLRVGAALSLDQLPRGEDDPFVRETLGQAEPLEVPDTRADGRFHMHPQVIGPPGVRFFAGASLSRTDARPRGLLYAADPEPRSLSAAKRRGLLALARQADLAIEHAAQQQLLQQAREANDALKLALHASESRFLTFMDNCPFLAYMKDEAGRFVFYNQRVADQFGISANEWIGKSVAEIWPADLATPVARHDADVRAAGSLQVSLEETRDQVGRLITWRSYKFPWTTESGERWLGGFSMDVTDEIQRRKQLEDANQQLARLATSDALTGLRNRRMLDERVEFEVRFARRHDAALAVVMLDLDNFKLRNDLFGHESGDEVLRRIGRMIARTLRATDMAARYGGEEFVILLPKADLHGAEFFLERLLEAMRREPWPHAPVTASIGVAALDPGVQSGKQLIAHADAAMYEAKRSGRNRIVTFPQLQAAVGGGKGGSPEPPRNAAGTNG